MMGANLQRQKKMGNAYSELPDSKPGLLVHFYGNGLFKTETLAISLETPKSCEEVCILCAKHLSASLVRFFARESEQIIGPLLLPLFGLYASAHSLQQWIPDGCVFNSLKDREEFYFRVKVQPANGCIPPGVFTLYLVWQCAEDFLSGRMWELFISDTKLKDVENLNRVALWILISCAQYQIEPTTPLKILNTPLGQLTNPTNACETVTFRKLLNHFPRDNVPPKLQKDYDLKHDYMLRKLSCTYMRKYVTDMFKKWGRQPLSVIHTHFIEQTILPVVPYYGMHFFTAERQDSGGVYHRVDLVIRPHQDRCQPGVWNNKKFMARLEDIFGAEIMESVGDRNTTDDSSGYCLIKLNIKYSPPMVFRMKSQEKAESFLVMLDSYCRLKVNYYESLCPQQLAGKSLHALCELRSFGPMEEKGARQLVRQLRDSDERLTQGESFYIIYQDCQQFHLLHVLAMDDRENMKTYNIHLTPAQNDIGFTFTVKGITDEDNEAQHDDWEAVNFHLKTTLRLGRQVAYKEEEVCGAMQFLKEEHAVDRYSYPYAGSESVKRQKGKVDMDDHPLLFTEDQVPLADSQLLVDGEFSTVYHIKQINGHDAILKKVKSNSPSVQNAYRRGAAHLLKLRECSIFFIKVYGSMLTGPVRILYESMPEGCGSLLSRLRDEDSPPLNWLQVGSVLKQLADCLCQLKEAGMVYRNLCCAKILIRCEDREALTIRLGDPSLSFHFDKLPISDPHNQRRLAWVDPERFGNLDKHTEASEIYSFGTTLWEILWRGKDPIQCIPLELTKNVEMFFERGGKLPDPNFSQVTATFSGSPGDSSDAIREHRENEETCIKGMVPNGHHHNQGDDSLSSRTTSSGNQDVDEYVKTKATQAGTKAMTLKDLNEWQNAENRLHSEVLHRLQRAVVALMHDCWNKNLDDRPNPNSLMKSAHLVETIAKKATSGDDLWHVKLCLQLAKETGSESEQQKAQELRTQVKEYETNQKDIGPEKVVSDLKQQMQQHFHFYIDASLLRNKEDMSPLENLEKCRKLGSGRYGMVVEAQLLKACETREEQEQQQRGERVAVKHMMGPVGTQNDETIIFLKEALTACTLDHKNIVKLMGVVMAGRGVPYMLVMEFADQDSLLSLIKSSRKCLGSMDHKLKLQRIAVDIACGMEYICQLKMIHGDLAARNVLLFSADGQGSEPVTAKLADFGLSHKLSRGQSGTYYYSIKKSTVRCDLPVFWMPRESIDEWTSGDVKLSISTDVWSYGVVLWEMYSREGPDAVLNRKQVKMEELIAHLQDQYNRGVRLPKPDDCPTQLYTIMQECWNDIPEARPNFFSVCRKIRELTEYDLE